MALTANQLQLKTYDDLRAIPDDGNRYELIFGEILMSPSPKMKHQRALARLFQRMNQFVEAEQRGELFFAPFDVKFSFISVVQPDLLYIDRENQDILGDDFIEGAPDIVVEALSPSSRMQDLVKKAALYTQHQVPEYWIVDPESKSITVNTLKEGQYVELGFDKTIARSKVLDGFEVRVSDIFAEPEWMKTSDPESE